MKKSKNNRKILKKMCQNSQVKLSKYAEKHGGITLISLVITIIILIILVGVTLSLVLGENGLFQMAKRATEEHQKAMLKEELEVGILDIQAEKASEGKEMTREDLNELANIGASMESTKIPAEGEYKDYFFEVDENYNVTILGKIKGEKPEINAEVVTEGVVAEGEKIEIRVTANVKEGTIQSIEAMNGAIEKTEVSYKEKIYEVSSNGTYYFKTKSDSGRSATIGIEVNTFIEKPKIVIKDVNAGNFTIGVITHYKEGLVTQYKYYVNGILKSSETANKEYKVKELEEDTTYTNIYVEAYFGDKMLASDALETKTTKELIIANKPIIEGTGLKPVTIATNGTLTEVGKDSEDWYNYSASSRQWANAKTKDGSMWVWIPRFAYKITYNNPNNKSEGGTIDVVYLKDDTNLDAYGKDVTSENYVDVKGNEGAYIVHPAFEDGTNNNFANGEWDKKLTGFWVAKFEAGYEGTANNPNTAQDSTIKFSGLPSWTMSLEYSLPNYYGTEMNEENAIKYPIFKANRPSFNYINIGEAYDLCRSLTANNNPYGFTNIVDSHLTKNSEWGAIIYLTHSKYGRNGKEVTPNLVNASDENNVLAVTGYGANSIDAELDYSRDLSTLLKEGQEDSWTTSRGQTASSTGNIYGIYDLSGGLDEMTAGYIAGGNFYNDYASYFSLFRGDSNKYKTKYEGTSNSEQNNYSNSSNIKRKGEAIWETSSSGDDQNSSWFEDLSRFLYTNQNNYGNDDGSITIRGGLYEYGLSGIFSFCPGTPYGSMTAGFRPILVVE